MPLSRRMALWLGMGMAATAVAMPMPRAAPPREDGLYEGASEPSRPLGGAELHLFSTANDNSRYRLSARWKGGPPSGVWLRLAGRVLPSSSTGHGSDGMANASFEIDRATATAAAAHFGLSRADRTELGAGLTADFQLLGLSEVRLVLRNGGEQPVGVVVGGRNRGPRNNRFHFKVQRHGEAMPGKEGHDFGGLSHVKVLAPGEELVLSEQLTRWADVGLPGDYAITASYHAELVPGEAGFPELPDEAHRTWDRTFQGELALHAPW
jgi:hypothetical protein